MRESEGDVIRVHALKMAKRAEIPEPGIFMVSRGQRIEHIPVARVTDALWICHPGSTTHGRVSQSNPFDPKHTRIINIVAQKYEDGRPNKRLRGRKQCNDLKKVATDHKCAFDQMVAIGIWQAEHERAALRPIDIEIAESGLEKDPFKWGANKIINILWIRYDGDLKYANITPMFFHDLCKELARATAADLD